MFDLYDFTSSGISLTQLSHESSNICAAIPRQWIIFTCIQFWQPPFPVVRIRGYLL
jgi:hypothetical protein